MADNLTIATRDLPNQIIPFFGKAQKLDSLFTVPLKALLIQGGIEKMFGTNLLVSIVDFNKTINNSPAIPGYTALASQIVTKSQAAGNGVEKRTALFLLGWYNRRLADGDNVVTEQRNWMVSW